MNPWNSGQFAASGPLVLLLLAACKHDTHTVREECILPQSVFPAPPLVTFHEHQVGKIEHLSNAPGAPYQVFKGATHWVETELTMTAAQPNSSACLQAGTCKPLGGYNVWAAIPPLPFRQDDG